MDFLRQKRNNAYRERRGTAIASQAQRRYRSYLSVLQNDYQRDNKYCRYTINYHLRHNLPRLNIYHLNPHYLYIFVLQFLLLHICFYCLFYTSRLFCAVVIGYDGNHTVVKTEHGHNDKALKLEVHTVNGGGKFAETIYEYLV